MIINTGHDFYDSDLDDRSETPTPNNNAEPQFDNQPSASMDRQNINECIEEFSKIWAPKRTQQPNRNSNNNNNNDQFNTIQSARSGSFRWTGFRLQPPPALTLEVDPNAWDLPASSHSLTGRIDINCAPSNANSSVDTPRAVPPVGRGDSECNQSISLSNEMNSNSDDDDGPTLDVIRLMLDQELQPINPDPHDQMSQQIFNEHKKLAKEYLKVPLIDSVRCVSLNAIILMKFFFVHRFKQKSLM